MCNLENPKLGYSIREQYSIVFYFCVMCVNPTRPSAYNAFSFRYKVLFCVLAPSIGPCRFMILSYFTNAAEL